MKELSIKFKTLVCVDNFTVMQKLKLTTGQIKMCSQGGEIWRPELCTLESGPFKGQGCTRLGC